MPITGTLTNTGLSTLHPFVKVNASMLILAKQNPIFASFKYREKIILRQYTYVDSKC